MKTATLSLLIVSLAFGAVMAYASGPIAVYALIEKVVLEPNESAPQRAQIWGAFSLWNERGASYSPAQRGYLYYRMDTCIADIEKTTRDMWSDLKKKAGSGQAVGFGGRWLPADASGMRARIRKSTDKPESPDSFSLGNPVVALGSSQADITAKLKAALQSK